MNNLHNPSVGEILKEEFLLPLSMSQNALAKAINVPSNRIHGIINGTRRITANTDLKLCKLFGLSGGYFLRMQIDSEIMDTVRHIGSGLQNIKPLNFQHAVNL